MTPEMRSLALNTDRYFSARTEGGFVVIEFTAEGRNLLYQGEELTIRYLCDAAADVECLCNILGDELIRRFHFSR